MHARQINDIGFIIILLLLGGPALAQAAPPIPPASPFAPLPCVDEPEETRRDKEAFTHVTPKKDKRIGSVVCMGGQGVWRDAKKRLRACTIARPVTLDAIEIPADSYTHFHANGRPSQTHLASPHTLETASGLQVACAADHVSLSDSGQLKSCQLASPITIKGIQCRAGEHTVFHPDGSLWRATLDAPVDALGTRFEAGTSLNWHPGGEVEGAWLSEAQVVAGYHIQHDFSAYPSNTLRTFELAEPRTLSDHPFPKRSKIWLRRDGSVQRAEYISREGFLPHGEQWTDTLHLRFDCAGKDEARTEHWQAPSRPRKFRK